jgi:3-oxoacyl-[acyl-carrier-protein] synthase-3
MRWNDIYIGAVAAALGRVETTASAVADGRYDSDQRLADGYVSARIADGVPAVELAVAAAKLALSRAGTDPDDVQLVMHASIAHQGIDHFAPASYVQSRTVRGRANALEVRQQSNGGMGALDMAAAYLAANTDARAVLLATSDVFPPPAYERYGPDGGVLLSDGGTALVLRRGSGVARLLSTVVIGDTSHHGLYNDNAPWTTAPGGGGWPVNMTSRQDRYIAELGGPEAFVDIVRSLDEMQQETVRTALAEAGAEVSDIDWWVFPNVGDTLVDWDTYKDMGIDESRATLDWGHRVGHLGAGDQIAGLAHLLESRIVRVGDRVLLNAAGQGFTFGSAVVEIVEEPNWTNSAD